MSIGIMDQDFSTYVLVPFNLEAMKISAYYKRRNEIVILTNQFTPDRHQKFYYLKDYEDGKYPSNLLTEKNVRYYGLAFTNNEYHHLPIEVEKMRPDTGLYAKFETLIKSDTRLPKDVREKVFHNLTTAEHCRLSLDGKTIWPEYGTQFKNLASARNIIFHDYNLNAIENGYETVQSILSRARTDGWATRVGMKFPVQVSNGADLLKWSSLRTNSTFYSIQYTGVIPDNDFNQWVGVCKEKTIYNQMDYIVTAPWYEENDFIKDLLPKIFRQVILSRSYRIFFLLKYSEDFFTDKRWCDVLKLFNFYHNSLRDRATSEYLSKISEDTLFNFAASCSKQPKFWYKDAMTISQIRDVFYFVRDNHPELFKDFYECNAKNIGGKL